MDAMSDTKFEYLHQKKNESKYSEEKTKIKHANVKITYQKTEKQKHTKLQLQQLWSTNWNKLHDRPVETKIG